MLAYMCKKCGQFTVLGFVNKFDEHFCNRECYRKYCEDRGYDYRPSDIWEVDRHE